MTIEKHSTEKQPAWGGNYLDIYYIIRNHIGVEEFVLCPLDYIPIAYVTDEKFVLLQTRV